MASFAEIQEQTRKNRAAYSEAVGMILAAVEELLPETAAVAIRDALGQVEPRS